MVTTPAAKTSRRPPWLSKAFRRSASMFKALIWKGLHEWTTAVRTSVSFKSEKQVLMRTISTTHVYPRDPVISMLKEVTVDKIKSDFPMQAGRHDEF